MSLQEAAEKVIAYCQERGMQRVKDAHNTCEDENGDVLYGAIRRQFACRACATGAVRLAKECGIVGDHETKRLCDSMIHVLGNRGDSVSTLTTVPDIEAVYALLREAAALGDKEESR